MNATKGIILLLNFVMGMAGTGLSQTGATPAGLRVEETRLGPISWSELNPPTVSADGRHVGYFLTGGGCPGGSRSCVAINGQPSPMNPGTRTDAYIYVVALSPDGKRFAYGAQKGNKAWVVMDGQDGPTYDTGRCCAGPPRALTFSPDGNALRISQREAHRIICQLRWL